MMANSNAVTFSVALLLSLFLFSNAVDVDPTSITATQVKDEIAAVDSEPTTSEEEGKTDDRVVFHPAVESISAVNPDLIAHSLRIPFHRRAGRPRCRRGHADGFLRLPSGQSHRHIHRREGFGFAHERMQEKNEVEEKESVGADEVKKEFDEEGLQHKWKKMRKMRRENKDDDDEKMEEFEHKRKKMMRFNNGKVEEFEHKHEKDDDDKKEEGKTFGPMRMRYNDGKAEEFKHEHRHKHEDVDDNEEWKKFEHKREKMMRFNNGKAEEFEHEHEHEKDDDDEKEEGRKFGPMKRMRYNDGKAEEFKQEHGHRHEDEDDNEREEWKKFEHKRMRRFRKEREEGGFMDRVHHLFNGFF